VSEAAQVIDSEPPTPGEDQGARVTTSKVAKAAGWEVGAQVVAMAVRLGSNLILTRLLNPEVFGLMALLHSIIFVLALLSDVGLSQAVIASKRAEDPDFLDTAWTLHVVRGVTLYVASVLIAWPCSYLLDEPRILWLLPAGNLVSLVHGFTSIKLFTLRRQVRLLPLIRLELTSYVAGVIATIVLAYFGYGIASTLAGLYVTCVVNTVGSHLLPGPRRVRLMIDPAAKTEILHFGRWIFFSSSLTAATQRGDQFFMGRKAGAAQLGIYQIALTLAELPEVLVGRVINGVLFPALSQVKNASPREFGDVYYRARSWIDPLAFIALGGLMGMSDWVIALLYDDRYLGAASMLRILALRTAAQLSTAMCESCFFASGESQFGFRRAVFVSIAMVIALPLGDHFGGLEGLLWGLVISRFAAFPVLWPAARERGFLRIHRELMPILYLGVGYGLGKFFEWLLPAA
jgi:O-antigen/teichoic acid export membrane protein